MSVKNTERNRIAKNTILLYLRSIIVMIVSIYSSRVLLSVLGIEDFGLYNVVGGIVAMFASIKSVLAAAVQRFLNYEKGLGNFDNVRKIFNISIIIHFSISLIFGIVVEIIGIWYINEYLIIPKNNIDCALFVFHCSILASMISICTIPYDAVVIANEKMGFFSLQSILDIILKLGIIFILPILPFTRIKTYAVLILIVTVLIRIISILYTKRFDECKKIKYWNKSMGIELLKFSGWNFMGCISYSIIEEVTNLILNSFGGVVVNAARGIAYQVRSAIMTLSNNVFIASQPHATQIAASSSRDSFWNIIFAQSRIMFFIVMLTALPVFVFAAPILKLWLDIIPPNTTEFVRALVIYMIVMSFQKSIDLSFKAYNIMAKYQLIDAGILLTVLPISYYILKCGFPYHYIFYTFSIVRIFDYVALLFLARQQIGLNLLHYFSEVVIPAIKGIFIFVLLSIVVTKIQISDNIIYLCLATISLFIAASLMIFLLCFNDQERSILKEGVRSFYNKLRKHNDKD